MKSFLAGIIIALALTAAAVVSFNSLHVTTLEGTATAAVHTGNVLGGVAAARGN